MKGFSIHKCALCSAELAGLDTETVDQIMAAHHAVCPKRPIAVGETVRIVRTTTSRLHGVIGKIIEISPEHMPYRVKIPGESYLWWCYEVERIPRPAEAQAMVYNCTRCGRTDSVTADVCPGCRASTWTKPRPASPELLAQRDRLVQQSYEASGVPGLALVDGLDREVCLARWMENRLAIEGGAVPPKAFTPAQIACGRALWLERYGALRGDALRAKVAAGREAERCRVTYCEIDPCD